MQRIHKQRARLILVLVVGLWGATVWGLTTGAFTGGEPAAAQTCHNIDDIPVGQCPAPASGSASPTGSATPSRSPSASRTPTPTPSSPSPRPTQSSSPSPSPSGSTPPPPSVQEADSDISIAYDARRNSFKGRVTSGKARCETGRRVTIKKVKKGKDATAGRDRTNRRGKWSLRERNPRGRYYAKVAEKSYAGNNNRTIICKAARSRTIRP